VGGACGSQGRGEESVQGLGGKSQQERDHLKDQRVDGWDQNGALGDWLRYRVNPAGSG
jgi:hypothetical protein